MGGCVECSVLIVVTVDRFFVYLCPYSLDVRQHVLSISYILSNVPLLSHVLLLLQVVQETFFSDRV